MASRFRPRPHIGDNPPLGSRGGAARACCCCRRLRCCERQDWAVSSSAAGLSRLLVAFRWLKVQNSTTGALVSLTQSLIVHHHVLTVSAWHVLAWLPSWWRLLATCCPVCMPSDASGRADTAGRAGTLCWAVQAPLHAWRPRVRSASPRFSPAPPSPWARRATGPARALAVHCLFALWSSSTTHPGRRLPAKRVEEAGPMPRWGRAPHQQVGGPAAILALKAIRDQVGVIPWWVTRCDDVGQCEGYRGTCPPSPPWALAVQLPKAPPADRRTV